MSANALIAGLWATLNATNAFKTAMTGGIYQLQAPQNASFPHCVVTFLPDELKHSFGSITSHDMTVQFDVYHKDTDGLSTAAGNEALLYTLLGGNDGVAFSATGFDRGLFTWLNRLGPSQEDDMIRLTSEGRIRGTDF